MADMTQGPTRLSYLDWSDEGKAGIGRYVLGVGFVLLVLPFLSGVGAFPVTLIDPNYRDSLIESELASFLAFVISFVGVPWIVHLLHKRPWWSVAMPTLRFNRADLALGFWVSTVIGLVLLGLSAAVGVVDAEFVAVDPVLWLELLVIASIGIFIQAGSEELMFRGYATQFVRRLTSNPVVVVTIPAILFALPHLGNLGSFEGSVAVKLTPYLASGLLYGWAAYRSGSLWLSLGLHLSNNLTNVVLAGPRGDVLETGAPIQYDITSLNTVAGVVVATSVVTVIVLEWFLRRRERDGHAAGTPATPATPTS